MLELVWYVSDRRRPAYVHVHARRLQAGWLVGGRCCCRMTGGTGANARKLREPSVCGSRWCVWSCRWDWIRGLSVFVGTCARRQNRHCRFGLLSVLLEIAVRRGCVGRRFEA